MLTKNQARTSEYDVAYSAPESMATKNAHRWPRFYLSFERMQKLQSKQQRKRFHDRKHVDNLAKTLISHTHYV